MTGIYAHLGSSNIRVEVVAGSYQRADGVRKSVSASRYSKALSDRDRGMFAFLYPLSVEKCFEMREAWGSDLKVSKALGAWFRQQSQNRKEHIAQAKASDAILPRLSAQYPKLNAWLKGDQRVTAAWIASAYRGAGLLADEVGTGKTAGVLAGLLEAGIDGPTVIVCPKVSVRAVWLREISRHTDVPVYACYGNRKRREKVIGEFLADTNRFKVLVVVAEMLRVKAVRVKGRITEFFGYEYPDLFEVNWAACVIDESHKVLGALDVVKANLAGEGIKALHYTANPLRLAVSATPFGKGGRTEALFGTLHWLWPDEFTSKWAWLGRYFDVMDERVFVRGGGGMTKTVKRVGNVLNEAGLWDDLGPRVLRRTMEEVSPEHRGLKNWLEVLVEMEGPQLLQYKTFTRDAEIMIDGGYLTTVGVLDYLTRARQFANGELRKEGGRVSYTGFSAKIDRLLEHIDDLAPGRKIVIASQYNEFLDAVERRLAKAGHRWFRLDGSTTDNARTMMMEDFQGTEPYRGGTSQGDLVKFTGPNVTCRQCNVGRGRSHGERCPANHPRLFLLNTKAGGVSITLDAADELHALDESDPDTMTQLYGRIFRRGRVHEVFFYAYRSLGTVDERLAANNQEKWEEQAKLLDGPRGLEYARGFAQYKGGDE